MPHFDKEGFDQLGVCDPRTSQAYTFDLPHQTNDPAEIRALKAGGAVETAPPKPSRKDGDDK